MRHARYLYIKRNIENVWGARYTLGARYLSKNTVLIWLQAVAFDRRAEFRKSVCTVLNYRSGLCLDNKLMSCSEAVGNITEGFNGFSQSFQTYVFDSTEINFFQFRIQQP